MLNRAVCLLGSATPSLESFLNAEAGKYKRLRLTKRIDDRKLPYIHIVDMRAEVMKKRGMVSLSDFLAEKLRGRFAAREQSILFLNRRGYSSSMVCRECGFVAECAHCSVAQTYHRTDETLKCHLCGETKEAPLRCPQCGSEQIRWKGLGTQRVEEVVKRILPSARVVRMDADAMSRKNLFREILSEFRLGRIDVLVGTQMIAKGLDFPNVLLVGVVNADTAMNLPDFRATERTFGLLAQVAGRTGRGQRGGEVVIQTYNPAHPAIRCAVTHDYRTFAAGELAIRREAGYPPFVHLLNAIFSGRVENVVRDFADRTSDELRGYLRKQGLEERVLLLGPAPCPLEKLRGRFRYHLILKSEDPELIRRAGEWVAGHAKAPSQGGCRLALDRDPMSLM
jgi:primosomal protein N' (replication factor Y)